ncbi:MAG: divergent polysaccharide deacetylase family protein [Deltaproteobacteria bacterium]|nr:divergent polysaccharide deacetylase family protein [Deltaproteobacteria bacterium]
MNKLVEIVRKNRIGSVIVGIAILVLLIVAISLFRSPRFPDTIPSAEKSEIRDRAYQSRLKYFQQFSRYLRENHGGMLLAEAIDQQSPTGETFAGESNVYTFRQQYKFLNQPLLIDLSTEFSEKHQMQVEIRDLCRDQSRTTSCFEMDIKKADAVWIRVLLESPKSKKTTEPGKVVYKDRGETDRPEEKLPVPVGSAKLVIVIDDLGYQMDVFSNLVKLDYEITYSILPQLAYSQDTAEIATQAGRMVMLHLPMQPKDQSLFNPGPGALLIQDSSAQINAKMVLNLSTVPYALGVNNHMGSAYTQYAEGLDTMMRVLNENELFFLDSKTAPGDTAKRAAKKHSVTYLSRDIFLDNDKEEALIQKQLFKAVRLARKRGWAIAIGHPYPTTYAVLAKYLPELEAQSVVVTKLADLVN